MAQKWRVLANGDVTVGNYHFTGPFVEVHGCYTTHVLGVELPVLVATVAGNERKSDPDNPRLLAAEQAKIAGNLSGAGQERIKKFLLGELKGAENNLLKRGADQLKASIELHGGQNECLWICNKVVIEGNRRTPHFDNAVCLVYPNETTPEQIFAIVSQRHVAGPMEWASYAKAKQAYRALVEFDWDMKKIVAHFKFTSEKDAEKYIHSFVWFNKSGLDDITQWSKFHHAYVPTLVYHFGYIPATREFDPTQRRPANNKTPHPNEVDKIAGRATDFNWFVNLIKDGKVTDCRHCDGVVAPAIRDAEEPHGEKVLELLQRNPAPVVTVRTGRRGKPQKSQSPAEAAGVYLKIARSDNALTKGVQGLEQELTAIIRSATKRKEYGKNTLDNHVLRTALEVLQVRIGEMCQYVPQQKDLAAAQLADAQKKLA